MCLGIKPDFFMFGIEDSQIEPLEEGSIGRFLFVENDITEFYIKNLEDLPIDVIVTSLPNEANITLNTLVTLANIRSYITKYFFIESANQLTNRELQELREIGVDGFIFNEKPFKKHWVTVKIKIKITIKSKKLNSLINSKRVSIIII